MPGNRIPRWSAEELAILRSSYPEGGASAVHALLPHRTHQSIAVKAHALGIHTTHRGQAPTARLSGHRLAEAIKLREEQNWSFAKIGAHFGISETAASSAVLIAQCSVKGYRPAERDATGRLSPEGIARLRYALKKGLKAVDIQLRLGVSSGCVAEQRRRYNAELRAAGKALLPPPGGGVAYSGVKVAKTRKLEVERLFMEGLGTFKVSERTGVSKTVCTRIRKRLVKRLKTKGEALPGCDLTGKRHVQAESSRFVTASQKAVLSELILAGTPVARAAAMTAVGASTAYKLRDELSAELAASGRKLPAPKRLGRVAAGSLAEPDWPPSNPAEIYAFRKLLTTLEFAEAKSRWQSEKRAERTALREAARMRAPSFEEQLAKVASGKLGIVAALPRLHLEPKLAA